MKIVGNIQVSYWTMPVNGQGPNQRSTLVIGKQPVTKEFFLVVQNARNPSGVKYKIVNNVEQFFTKFEHKGKATVRFSSPPHDLSINCDDALTFVSFMKVLRHIVVKKGEIPDSWLSSLYDPSSVPKRAQTKLVITEPSEYPALGGFPRTLNKLAVNIQMCRFDPRILKMRHLRELDLGNNQLKVIPAELGTFRLVALSLANNLLGETPDWSFLYSGPLAGSLRRLDISGNKIEKLPLQIGNLTQLVTLNIGNNNLESLPRNIGRLKTLRNLSLCDNKVGIYPGTIERLRLETIDVSGNRPVSPRINEFPGRLAKGGALSLVELAATVVMRNKVPYYGIVPKSIMNYLEGADFCRCGVVMFGSWLTKYSTMHLRTISASVAMEEGNTAVVFICDTYCNSQCAHLFGRYVPMLRVQVRHGIVSLKDINDRS